MDVENIQSLDLLEQRLTRLEQKMLGKGSINDVDITKVKPVTNVLHEVDTVLISSISGREKINTLLKKVDVLHQLLDPSYLDSFNNVDAKIEAVLESEKDIYNYVNQLDRLEAAYSILNDETIEQLPNLSDRINNLISNVLKNKEQCDKQTAELIEISNSYKNCVIQISALLVQMDSFITQLEINSQPKTPTD
ncbi:nuclease SbcCD subunit C-like [Planococcus citri]|uniref:nuclease SbcCD subunit C-like n=1 Tax=Planococcus citri TaxID=170843 RepID=UPI0031FA2F61